MVQEQLADGTFPPEEDSGDGWHSGAASRGYDGFGGGRSGGYRGAGDSIATPGASVQVGACGLSNLGNTCFMNSMVQPPTPNLTQTQSGRTSDRNPGPDPKPVPCAQVQCLAQLPPIVSHMIDESYKKARPFTRSSIRKSGRAAFPVYSHTSPPSPLSW